MFEAFWNIFGKKNKLSYSFLRGDFGSAMKLHKRSNFVNKMTNKHRMAGEVEIIGESSPNAGIVMENERFDIVSCQFALHYSFGSEARAVLLKPGLV